MLNIQMPMRCENEIIFAYLFIYFPYQLFVPENTLAHSVRERERETEQPQSFKQLIRIQNILKLFP